MEAEEMEAEEIRRKIKEIVSNVTSIDPEEIADDASAEDLMLDSLSGLEIGVDIDYEFKLGVPEEKLGELRTLQDAVELVQECLAAKQRPSTGPEVTPETARRGVEDRPERRTGEDRRKSKRGIRSWFLSSLFLDRRSGRDRRQS